MCGWEKKLGKHTKSNKQEIYKEIGRRETAMIDRSMLMYPSFRVEGQGWEMGERVRGNGVGDRSIVALVLVQSVGFGIQGTGLCFKCVPFFMV